MKIEKVLNYLIGVLILVILAELVLGQIQVIMTVLAVVCVLCSLAHLAAKLIMRLLGM